MADRFRPVITAVRIQPSPAYAGEVVLIEVAATDAAALYTSTGQRIKLKDGRMLAAGRDSVAIEYESAYTGAEHDGAVKAVSEGAERWDAAAAALNGLETLLASVVGVPNSG